MAKFVANARLSIPDLKLKCGIRRFYAQRLHCRRYIQVLSEEVSMWLARNGTGMMSASGLHRASHSWTVALLCMVLFALQSTASNAESVVEMVIRAKGDPRPLCENGRPPEYGKPCKNECVAVIRLVSGTGTTFTLPSGKRANITEAGSCACIAPPEKVARRTQEDITYTASCPALLEETAADVPPPPPSPPPPVPCVSPTSPHGC